LSRASRLSRRGRKNQSAPQSFVGEKSEDTTRQDAAAALLSTLTLGANSNSGATAPAASGGQPASQQQQHQQQAQQQQQLPATNSVPMHQNLVLDKKSLQLSLLSLLQEDRFIDIIHSQYLKVVRKRAERQQQQSYQDENGN